MKEFLCDDKSLVITAVWTTMLVAMFMMGLEAKEIITNGFSGLFGIAIGQKLGQ